MDVQEVDPDLVDPCPDIHALFCHYNDLYFEASIFGFSNFQAVPEA